MTTTPTLRELYDAASALPPAARRAFLDAEVGDAALRRKLEAMLATDTAEDALPPALHTPVAEWAEIIGTADEMLALPAGGHIGPYRLNDVIGEGGSSTVFAAERDLDGARQNVALKLLHRGLHTPAARRQFDREQRALVQLSHPGIAHLIDGGVTAAGLPYLVLERIDGERITDYVRGHGLGVRERLGLFLKVCAAVAAAHRALIVHRDLKPANVLVDGEGRVKLLDFGIAKLLDDVEDDTRTFQRQFTPAYAAPEQRSGAATTTATDVFALGVLLGELLTGVRLAAGEDVPAARVREDTAPGALPIAPDALRRVLRGDLGVIVRKAIAESPDERYASASELGDDVRRWLQDRPVRAQPATRGYRLRKYLVRHRGSVAATGLFLVAILTALGVALWQTNVARQEAARANSVRDFVLGMFDSARAELPRDLRLTPEALVAQAESGLRAATGLDAATRAEMLRSLGEVELSLSNYPRALALFEEARALPAAHGAESIRSIDIAAADALQRAERNAEATARIDPLLEELRTSNSPLRLRALRVRAAAAMALGQPDAAIAHAREAATLGEARFGPDAIDTLAVRLEVGNALASAQRYPEAIAALTPVLARWKATQSPEDARYVAALGSLAVASDGVGDKAAGEARFRELLALKQRIYSPPHDAIAKSLRDLAVVVRRAEKYAEAKTLLDEALAMQRQVLGEHHQEVAKTHDAIGELMVAQRRFPEAESAYRAAMAACAAAAIRDEVCPRARNNLGMSFYRQNRLDEARVEMEAALAERRAILGENHPTIAYSLSTLANVAIKQDHAAEAVAFSGEALAILARAGMAASREAALIRFGYAQALWKADRNEEALGEIDRVLVAWQRLAPEAKARRVSMLVQKVQILEDLRRPDDAKAVAAEAVALEVNPAELTDVAKATLRIHTGRPDLYPDPSPAKR